MKKLFSTLAMVGTIALASDANAQGHYHLYVGAASTGQDAPLFFDDENGLATNNGFVATLVYTNGGKYAGFFQPGGITVAVLAATGNNGGPVPNAPALGSRVFIQLVSVQGPPGGSFGFWETNATNPTFSLACGAIGGTNAYCASQNDGSPGTDPYGHIHGRAFTATVPGLYTVGLRAYDGSTNGVNGGQIQSPSGTFYLQFQAGLTLTSLRVENQTAIATFGATGGQNLVLQRSDGLTSTNWQQVGDMVTGDDHFHSVTDDSATGARRFYRVVGTPAN